ncbi:hypothetical protein V8J88_05470 [Massilia sp. W12]|uniref:hypothetical protein n=1 Tax=Massilia sp. W12 TaxID=3126507 RepID=UPI0030CF2CF0
MSEIKCLNINTPFGVARTREAYTLKEVLFEPRIRSLTLRFNVAVQPEKAAPQRHELAVRFNSVHYFESMDYDDGEYSYSKYSNSCFDELLPTLSKKKGKNTYIIWFYDNAFRIDAGGYSFLIQET